MDLQERLTAFAMLGATWVMWLLVALSVVGLAIVLERIYQLATSRDNIESLRSELLRCLANGDLDEAKARLQRSRSFEARVVHAGMTEVTRGTAAVEERMAGETMLCRLDMEKNLAFLGTVGNNAPFVGLLGTVIGVIRAFHQLDSSGGKVTSGLMNEVGEALVATAIGILVALPSVAFFNLFQRLIKGRLGRAAALGHDLLSYLKGRAPAGGAMAKE
ncbi:MAG: MotA/TolQ/ExbB proton channel family protein [Polyangiales bacterium]